MYIPLRFIALFIGCVLLSCPLMAGTFVVSKESSKGDFWYLRFVRMYLDSDAIRVDYDVDDFHQSAIYMKGDDHMLLLDRKAKTYVTVSREMASALVGELEALKTSWKSQLHNLSPSQSQVASADAIISLLDSIPALGRVDQHMYDYSPTTFGVRIRHWEGVTYDVGFRGKKRHSLTLVPWYMVGIKKSDFDMLNNMDPVFLAIFQSQSYGLIPGLRFDMSSFTLDGYPVRIVQYRNDTVMRETALIKVRKWAFEPEIFSIPEDYIEFDGDLEGFTELYPEAS